MWTIPTKVRMHKGMKLRKHKGMKLQRLHHVKFDIDVSNQSSYVDNTNKGTKLEGTKVTSCQA